MDIIPFLIAYLPDILYSVTGIIGYYTGITWLLSTAVGIIMLNTFLHNLNPFTFILHAISCVIGVVIAIIFNLDIWRTIEVAICFEWLARQIIYHVGTLIANFRS